jgi:PAS domain S-box-containing protein
MAEHPPDRFPLSAASFLDDVPLPIVIYALDGTMVAMNSNAETFWGLSRSDMSGFSVFDDPTAAVVDVAATYAKVRNGEIVIREPTRDVVARNTAAERQIWYQAIIFPVRAPDHTIAYAGYIYRDVTAHIEQSEQIALAQEEIATQQALIQELSIPVVEVWEGILLAPLVGAMDARRAATVTEQLLAAIVNFSADVVILDVTGVPFIDAVVAASLVNTARAVQLLGSDIALTGVRSEIAQAVVRLEIDLSQFATHANLQAGLAWAFARRKLQVTRQS